MGENTEEAGRTVAETTVAPDHAADGGREHMATSKSTRSPAFQFYPYDFLCSRKVDRMSMTERGIYITLLSHCWIDRSIPTDLTELAAACRMKPEQFERIWSRGVLHQCFELRGDRFINPRLEVERKAQAEYSRKQKERAEKRWRANATALPGDATALPHAHTGNALISSHPISSHPTPKEKKDSAEPLRDSTPVVMTFMVVGNPEQPAWDLHQSRIDALQTAYPNLDVLAECRRAVTWVEANPSKRKTAKGMPAFLVNWMSRQTNQGPARSAGSSSASNPKTAGNADVFRRFIERGRPA